MLEAGAIRGFVCSFATPSKIIGFLLLLACLFVWLLAFFGFNFPCNMALICIVRIRVYLCLYVVHSSKRKKKKKDFSCPWVAGPAEGRGPGGGAGRFGGAAPQLCSPMPPQPLGFGSEMHGIWEPWDAPDRSISDLTHGGFGLWSLSDALW